jgi:hypothetical protein
VIAEVLGGSRPTPAGLGNGGRRPK